MFYIFTSENITFSKYAFYFINNSLYFITLYMIKLTINDVQSFHHFWIIIFKHFNQMKIHLQT